ARRNLTGCVISIRTTSAEARVVYDGEPIDLLFIDGSHDYEDVLADIDLWTPLLADNAIVAFNDPYSPGVNRALRERMLSRRLPVEAPRHVNNTLFAISRRAGRTSNATKRALALYLWIERMRFKMLKLALKGIFENAGLVYVRPSATRSEDWTLFDETF
ncbi:MAG: class I SAM-dependent methyltransferase, partial [Polyangiaceae bacterium]